ncbi:MAG: 4-(cytidine 5'-diphospho)-2-C-methyl-D-erythritol kinase [Clostridia bacterium]|nr:4-(cytidine 5'-diphospho)-2-C-methyl-D-erythritol kinase [Clostridia bacterium]
MKRDQVTESAPAKVNLTLSVGQKRADGYHDIVTLMETVSLFDKLTVRVENSLLPEIKLSITGNYPVPEDPSNLVVRAAEAFFDALGERFPISISLAKNIPTEAGLGGGSSDAAATLRALNRMVDEPLSSDRLALLAARLGSDVAFCLFGGTAICSGRGELIDPVSDPGIRYYTVVMGSDRVSTPAAYRSLDELREKRNAGLPDRPRAELKALARGENIPLFNDFEASVFPDHPSIAKTKARLLSLGASDALMSGSGAAVFGVFHDLASAERAAAAFSSEDAFAVTTVGKYYP